MKAIILAKTVAPSTGEEVWRVLQIQNSLTYNIGDLLRREVVEDLCDMSGIWRVTIKEAK